MKCSAGYILVTEVCSHKPFGFIQTCVWMVLLKVVLWYLGSISSSMGNNCPLAVPLLSHSKSTNLRGVTRDLQVSRDRSGSVKNRLVVFHLQGGGFVVHHGHNLSQR